MDYVILKSIIIDFINNYLAPSLGLSSKVRSFDVFLKHYNIDDPDFGYYRKMIQKELETPIGSIYVLKPQHDTMMHWFAIPTPYGYLVFAF
ncbi:MAG TPA: hypothetical protein ENF45_04310 [Bacteroidetes bacterium]|nr:hypothetical protein [Bacteroidota bacterium]